MTIDRTIAFQPLWPPVDDDGFIRLPKVCKAREMYRTQKNDLRDLVERSMLAPLDTDSNDESQRIATMLHNIAGTAAHFDERDFGLFAARLEQPVRSAFTAELLRPLCAEIVAGLGPRNEL